MKEIKDGTKVGELSSGISIICDSQVTKDSTIIYIDD